MQVREIMTPNPRVLTPDAPVSRAARIMRELDVGGVPVVDDGDGRALRGMITDRDIAVRHVAEQHTDDCPVSEHMSADTVATAKPEDEVEQLMSRMRRERVRRIPVVDDAGQVVGIVAQADLAVETGPGLESEVEQTVEEISEPAEPQR